MSHLPSSDEKGLSPNAIRRPAENLDRYAADRVLAIDNLGAMGFVMIGESPGGSLTQWPDRVSDFVVVTRPARDHWRMKHPELLIESIEHEIVRAVVDPDAVHKGQHLGQEYTAIYFRRIDDRNDIVVVVSVAIDPAYFNSVITARKQKSKTRHKREQAFGVWRRG